MTFATTAALLRNRASQEFLVSNWPEGLKGASQRERELLDLMAHPCYRLMVRVDTEGYERLVVRPSAGMPSPITEDARAHIQRYKSDLIAWVKRTDQDRKRLREAGL